MAMGPDVPELKPVMSAAEAATFATALGRSRRYLEFGAGGSTLLAARAGIAQIDTVENDPGWIARLRRHPELAQAEVDGRLRLHAVDTGPIRDYGFPTDSSTSDRWPDYHEAVWARLAQAMPDTILVDGRFRLACALQAVRRSGPETTIIVHDFFNRSYYHRLLAFVDVTEYVDTLAVVRPRSNYDLGLLENWLDAAALDPR